jgi:hypothetical protein
LEYTQANMFCPQCRVEYRPGFARCSDCEVDLVEELTPLNLPEPDLNVNSRPDLATRPFFLAWFVPMSIYLLLIFGSIVRPRLIQNFHFGVFLFCFVVFGNLGGFWMLYQAVRYEKRVGKYVALAFVPFMFVWYSLVRVPLREEFRRDSDFIR